MIAALLLAAAAPSAVDAEYAFARDAQKVGQWTAFRKWADRYAVIFTPQAAWAQTTLPRKNPPAAVRWWPAHSFVSCDGRTAVNTGPFVQPNKGHGYFTTVWQRTGKQWRWVYDGGDTQTGALPTPPKPRTHRASCTRRAPGAPIAAPPPLTPKEARKTPEDNGRGQSADRTLGWDWRVDKKGGRTFRVFLWNGTHYAQVLHNQIAAP